MTDVTGSKHKREKIPIKISQAAYQQIASGLREISSYCTYQIAAETAAWLPLAKWGWGATVSML